MRGGMAGLVVDDKENTPGQSDGKKEKERERRRSGGRRLSISGSNSQAQYLRAIANRFKRQGGAGRGRILVHRPLRFDGSPFEFDSRSDGEKRRSFVVFEDVVDSVSFKPKEFATDLETMGKVPPAARSKNATLGECRTLMPRGTGEQAASIESVQQKSKYYALESIVAFQARAKAMFTATSRAPPVSPLVEAANQQESGARTPLEIQPRRWQRGGGGRVYTQCSLDTSELEDIEQLFRKMDKEDLEEELHRQELDMEMHKCDLTEEMQEKEHREREELLVSAEVSETYETGKVHVEEQANVCELPPEQFNCQDRGLLSPRVGGLEVEDEIANVELTTPHLRLDQEEPVPKPTPVILELGVSPESSDADRAIEQLTPVGHKCSGSKNQDLDSPQQIPEEVESQLEQTVNNVLVWSVELDPSRRRREIMEDYRNWRTPWLESLVHSSFRSAAQVPRSANDVLRKPAQLNVSMSLSSLDSSKLDMNGPAKNLVEAYEGEFLSTSLPPSGRESGQAEGVQIVDGEFLTCPDQATANEDEMRIALIENEREMQTWRDSKATLRSKCSSWPDQSPVRPIDLSAQCMGSLHEKPSESSLESPSSQAAELLRRLESVTATPLLQASFDTIGMSPTPPRDLCLYLGNPFGKMSGEDLSRRWLQFCTSPSVFSDVIARSKKSWKVESTFTDATSLAPTTSFPSEQLLQRTAEAYVQPNTEEEAVSSDGLDWKTLAHDEEVLLNAGEAAVSSDGSDGVMDYENDIDDISDDIDDISNDTTQIIQTGASSAYNDQEGSSALKECPQEDVPLDEDVLSLSLTPLKDNNPVATIIDPAVEYSLTHLEEEHIDQFVSSLQVTPVVDESRVERLNINGEDVSKVNHDSNSPAGKDGHPSLIKERITPGKDANQSLSQSQDECTPVRKQSKTKRSRKSTKTKKVDSPLDAGSKWSNGKRQSTRIRSKPLDWWRGERMLYGRVHSTLNTLIGIKHLSPDPVWPRPRTGDRKNKAAPQKFKVDSFVSDEHNELLRLAAQ